MLTLFLVGFVLQAYASFHIEDHLTNKMRSASSSDGSVMAFLSGIETVTKCRISRSTCPNTITHNTINHVLMTGHTFDGHYHLSCILFRYVPSSSHDDSIWEMNCSPFDKGAYGLLPFRNVHFAEENIQSKNKITTKSANACQTKHRTANIMSSMFSGLHAELFRPGVYKINPICQNQVPCKRAKYARLRATMTLCLNAISRSTTREFRNTTYNKSLWIVTSNSFLPWRWKLNKIPSVTIAPNRAM